MGCFQKRSFLKTIEKRIEKRSFNDRFQKRLTTLLGLLIVITIVKLSLMIVNPIPAGGGVQFDPPPVVFLHKSKSISLRLLKFSDFS